MNKNGTLLYIHGLGSNQNSRKFLNLKDYFKDDFHYDFIEWNNDSDINLLIHQKIEKYKNVYNLVIVGDSTGANFAYQLREIRNNTTDKLILTSPLLDIEKRIADFDFPKTLILHLIKIENPKNSMIIASKTDEILNQNYLFELPLHNVRLLEVKDGHRLEGFERYLDEIRNYIEN
jgi:predicted esterase YcpF (UPF0227 family)